jgi:putative flippase GtrA
MKYDFVNLLSLIDLLIICLEASTYFYLLHNAVNLHCALFIIKKIGIGVAVGINFYLSLLMIKRKLIIFN